MILQLNPSIPVITPRGSGEALFILDYGKEDDIMFIVAQDDTGEIWTYKNSLVRLHKNETIGRKEPSKIENK